MTHEQYIARVRDIVADTQDATIRARLLACKLTYGIGDGSYRGICYFGKWQNGQPTPYELVEVAASGEEHPTQLAGTTIHELAHVLAGPGNGHNKTWKSECDRLGLRLAKAAGHDYMLASFSPVIRHEIERLARKLADGKPTFSVGRVRKTRPCSLGIGTRGGTSRGAGSGSRLRLFECQCEPNPEQGITNKVRQSGNLDATCNRCGSKFEPKGDK